MSGEIAAKVGFQAWQNWMKGVSVRRGDGVFCLDVGALSLGPEALLSSLRFSWSIFTFPGGGALRLYAVPLAGAKKDVDAPREV